MIKRLLKGIRRHMGAILVTLVALLLWQLTAMTYRPALAWLWRVVGLAPPAPDLRFLSSPIEVALVAPRELSGGLLVSLWETTAHCLIAFSIALIVGVLLARILAASDAWQSALLPIVNGLSGIPPVVLLPLLLVAFRLGAGSVIALAVFGAVLSITLICYEEQSRVTREFKLMISNLGFTRLGTWLWELSTISGGLFTAAREGLRWSLILVVVGEMHGSVAGGIGAFVDSARLDQRYAAVYLGIIGCALLSVLLKAVLDVSAALLHTSVKSFMLGTRMHLRTVWRELHYEGS